MGLGVCASLLLADSTVRYIIFLQYLHADNPQCTPFWQFQYAQTQADTLSDIVPRDARADYVLIIGIRRRVTRVRFGVEMGSLCLGLGWGIRLLWV